MLYWFCLCFVSRWLDFETVLTVWYFLFFILLEVTLIYNYVLVLVLEYNEKNIYIEFSCRSRSRRFYIWYIISNLDIFHLISQSDFVSTFINELTLILLEIMNQCYVKNMMILMKNNNVCAEGVYIYTLSLVLHVDLSDLLWY